MTRTKHDLRSEATRRRLVTAARTLFGARGYADVGTEEIVRAAGVTRGALYHQFRDKADLFAAVAEEVEAGIAKRIAGAAGVEADPVDALRSGAWLFLDASRSGRRLWCSEETCGRRDRIRRWRAARRDG